MNEKMQEFMNSIGLTVELWVIVYTEFLKNGYDVEMALKHTESYINVLLKLILQATGDQSSK